MLKSIPLPNHRLGRCPFQVLHHHSINIIQYIYIYTRISGTSNELQKSPPYVLLAFRQPAKPLRSLTVRP